MNTAAKDLTPTPLLDDVTGGLRHRLRDRLHVRELRRRGTLASRILLALALVGPGVLVMLGDNDAGGVLTYAQTGAAYGIGFFLALMIPLGFLTYIIQEMTIRLGAVTRRGHAELIWHRYGPFWGMFSLFDLVVSNVLTLMTEFIGIRFGMAFFGVPAWLGIILSFVLIAYVLVFLRYWNWERISLWIAIFNVVFLPVLIMAHPDWAAVARAFVGGGWIVPGGFFSATFLLLVSANIGTTIAPWQLFFQQSCVVDKGLLPSDIKASRRDLMVGVSVMIVVAIAIIAIGGSWLYGLPNAQNLAPIAILDALYRKIGPLGAKLFALGLVEAGVLAAIVITASSAWAIGEAFDLPRSINERPRNAWAFYAPSLLGTLVAAGFILLPHLPLGFINLSVQVVATLFMPAAMLFLLMLVNDRELMGEYANSPRRNAVSIAILVLLIVCNALYGIATLFPHAL
jgi:Mn2+/Fe2+ NRAMP family transporter